MMELDVLVPLNMPAERGNCSKLSADEMNLFSRDDVFSAADAAAICHGCPIRSWCHDQGYEHDSAVAMTYGGELFKRRRPVAPRQVTSRPEYKE